MRGKELLVQVVACLCRLGLGGFFAYSAIAKIEDPGIFADAVTRYRLLPEFLVGLFSLTLPMLELVAGVALVCSKWSRESALLVVAMLVMFIIALLQAEVRGLDISCGCFGMPEKAGRFDLILAIARDVGLLVPAVWLAKRRNSWLLSFCRARAVSMLAVMSCAVVAGAVEIDVSDGPVRPGEWNSNFAAVQAEADKTHRPMVFIHASVRCGYCARLKKAISGEAFRQWREERQPLLAYVFESSKGGISDSGRLAIDFVNSYATNTLKTPRVGIYWPRENGITNRLAFSGRTGLMKVVKPEKPLVLEFMTALDSALSDYVAGLPGHGTPKGILKDSIRTITCRADENGTNGKISVKPKDGILPDGGTVTLEADPGKDSLFVDWHGPDGAIVGYEPTLNVSGCMPGGCYVGRFKRKADCRPPILLTPATTTLVVRIGSPIKYKIDVAEESKPVTFDFEDDQELPGDLRLNMHSGDLTIGADEPGTNIVKVVVVGSDSAHTRTNVQIRLVSTLGN